MTMANWIGLEELNSRIGVPYGIGRVSHPDVWRAYQGGLAFRTKPVPS